MGPSVPPVLWHIVATLELHSLRTRFIDVVATSELHCGSMARGKRRSSKPLKDDVVRVRMPTAQKQALVAAAARDGLELSAWLRQLALRAAGVLPERSE